MLIKGEKIVASSDSVILDKCAKWVDLAGEIIKIGKPTAVVLFNGRPLSISALAQSAPAALRMIGIQDMFTESGDYSALLRKYGISTDHIEAGAMQLVETNPR